MLDFFQLIHFVKKMLLASQDMLLPPFLLLVFMDEGSERDKTSRGGAYLRCPVFSTVHFSLRDEGSSEYIRVCEGGESLMPNF